MNATTHLYPYAFSPHFNSFLLLSLLQHIADPTKLWLSHLVQTEALGCILAIAAIRITEAITGSSEEKTGTSQISFSAVDSTTVLIPVPSCSRMG